MVDLKKWGKNAGEISFISKLCTGSIEQIKIKVIYRKK